MFLPVTRDEMKKLGWDALDIILVTGDAYIDSSYIGTAVIGKWLVKAGFRVGVISQPDCNSEADIKKLGEPLLYWGISGGSVDSMVSNYTATLKKRNQDDFTPGGVNNRRPDRAVMTYCNLVRRYFKNTKPLVIGGLEASLRRVTHYDMWDNKIRKPLLFDAKADYLVYGMGERQAVMLAESIRDGKDSKEIPGIAYISENFPENYIGLPSYKECVSDPDQFTRMFQLFYGNNDFASAKGLYQKIETGEHDFRYLIQNPPPAALNREELDAVYEMDYERAVHPLDLKKGEVRAMDTIRFSITTHRGCYGECSFCSIAVHQGRIIQNRSEESILREAAKIASLPGFKGYILDVGGPTANMYETGCRKEGTHCRDKNCLQPLVCPNLKNSHAKQIRLLKKIREIPAVKKAFVASGIRYDLILSDLEYGNSYIEELVKHHVSGQLKLAPEHASPEVLKRMKKPGTEVLLKFKKKFDEESRKAGKEQFLTYYFIAAHPGCSEKDMLDLKNFTSRELAIKPEQVQIFMPTPSTYSTLMYYTCSDTAAGEKIFVEKDRNQKDKQKEILTGSKERLNYYPRRPNSSKPQQKR